MQVTAFNIHYDSPQFDRMTAFLRDILRLPVKTTFSNPRRRGVIFDAGGAELELFGPAEGAAAVPPPPPVTLRIKLMVVDVSAEYARLTSAGVDIVELLADKSWGERSFTVLAPDGVRITLSERSAP